MIEILTVSSLRVPARGFQFRVSHPPARSVLVHIWRVYFFSSTRIGALVSTVFLKKPTFLPGITAASVLGDPGLNVFILSRQLAPAAIRARGGRPHSSEGSRDDRKCQRLATNCQSS